MEDSFMLDTSRDGEKELENSSVEALSRTVTQQNIEIAALRMKVDGLEQRIQEIVNKIKLQKNHQGNSDEQGAFQHFLPTDDTGIGNKSGDSTETESEQDCKPKKFKFKLNQSARTNGKGQSAKLKSKTKNHQLIEISIIETKASLGMNVEQTENKKIVVNNICHDAPEDVKTHMKVGDIIQKINNRKVSTPFEMQLVRNLVDIGDKLTFSIERINPQTTTKKASGAGRKEYGAAKPNQRKRPKRPRGAFIYFNQSARSGMLESNPTASHSEINQLLAKQWNAMAPEEKSTYNEKAKSDKCRYEKEKEEFSKFEEASKPPPAKVEQKHAGSKAYQLFYEEMKQEVRTVWRSASDLEIDKILSKRWQDMDASKRRRFEDGAKGDGPEGQVPSPGSGVTGKRKSRGFKDPNQPKKPLNSFMYFIEERRPGLTKEQPDLPHREVLKTLSTEWKALSNKEKEKFEAKAQIDQKRYKEQAAMYNAENPQFSSKTHGKDPKRQKPQKNPNQPKKPKNGFMFFAIERRPEILKNNPSLSVTEVMKVIAEEWKKVDKQTYEEKSQLDQKRYKEETLQWQGLGTEVQNPEAQTDVVEEVLDEEKMPTSRQEVNPTQEEASWHFNEDEELPS